jgi:hypothetical protein
MRRLNQILAFILIVGLALTTAHIISAQQSSERPGTGRRPGTGGRPGGDRQMDPVAMMEQMIGRRMENITQGMQEMNIPANEADVLKTQIEALLRMRMAPNTEMTQAMEELQKAIGAKDDGQIRTKLDAVKAKRKEQKAKDEKAEKELLEILPLKLEALLTVQGIVNGGAGGGMGFGRSFGGGGQRRQRGTEG